MQLLNNLTALVAAATTFNVLDYSKTNAIDLSYGDCSAYATIQTWTYVNNGNQQWTMTSGPSGNQVFSPECNVYWSYTSAATAAPAQAAVTLALPQNITSWIFSPVNPIIPNGPWNIIEASSGLALNAWAMDNRSVEPSAPISLEALVAGDTRQQFWLVAA